MLIFQTLVIWVSTLSAFISDCGTFMRHNGLSVLSANALEPFKHTNAVLGGALGAIADLFPSPVSYPVPAESRSANGMTVIYLPGRTDGSEVLSVAGGTDTLDFDIPMNDTLYGSPDNSSIVLNDTSISDEPHDLPDEILPTLGNSASFNEGNSTDCKQYRIEDHVQAIVDFVQTPEELQTIVDSISLKVLGRNSSSPQLPPDDDTLDPALLEVQRAKEDASDFYHTLGNSTLQYVNGLIGIKYRFSASLRQLSLTVHDSITAMQIEGGSKLASYLKIGTDKFSAMMAHAPSSAFWTKSINSMISISLIQVSKIFKFASVRNTATLAALCALSSLLWASFRWLPVKDVHAQESLAEEIAETPDETETVDHLTAEKIVVAPVEENEGSACTDSVFRTDEATIKEVVETPVPVVSECDEAIDDSSFALAPVPLESESRRVSPKDSPEAPSPARRRSQSPSKIPRFISFESNEHRAESRMTRSCSRLAPASPKASERSHVSKLPKLAHMPTTLSPVKSLEATDPSEELYNEFSSIHALSQSRSDLVISSLRLETQELSELQHSPQRSRNHGEIQLTSAAAGSKRDSAPETGFGSPSEASDLRVKSSSSDKRIATPTTSSLSYVSDLIVYASLSDAIVRNVEIPRFSMNDAILVAGGSTSNHYPPIEDPGLVSPLGFVSNAVTFSPKLSGCDESAVLVSGSSNTISLVSPYSVMDLLGLASARKPEVPTSVEVLDSGKKNSTSELLVASSVSLEAVTSMVVPDSTGRAAEFDSPISDGQIDVNASSPDCVSSAADPEGEENNSFGTDSGSGYLVTEYNSDGALATKAPADFNDVSCSVSCPVMSSTNLLDDPAESDDGGHDFSDMVEDAELPRFDSDTVIAYYRRCLNIAEMEKTLPKSASLCYVKVDHFPDSDQGSDNSASIQDLASADEISLQSTEEDGRRSVEESSVSSSVSSPNAIEVSSINGELKGSSSDVCVSLPPANTEERAQGTPVSSIPRYTGSSQQATTNSEATKPFNVWSVQSNIPSPKKKSRVLVGPASSSAAPSEPALNASCAASLEWQRNSPPISSAASPAIGSRIPVASQSRVRRLYCPIAYEHLPEDQIPGPSAIPSPDDAETVYSSLSGNPVGYRSKPNPDSAPSPLAAPTAYPSYGYATNAAAVAHLASSPSFTAPVHIHAAIPVYVPSAHMLQLERDKNPVEMHDKSDGTVSPKSHLQLSAPRMTETQALFRQHWEHREAERQAEKQRGTLQRSWGSSSSFADVPLGRNQLTSQQMTEEKERLSPVPNPAAKKGWFRVF